MTSTLSKQRSTKKGDQRQLKLGIEKPIEADSSSNPVKFSAIAADAPRGKEPKGLRVERQLLQTTETLREQTNLNFSEYVEHALIYFNACLTQHLETQETHRSDAV